MANLGTYVGRHAPHGSMKLHPTLITANPSPQQVSPPHPATIEANGARAEEVISDGGALGDAVHKVKQVRKAVKVADLTKQVVDARNKVNLQQKPFSTVAASEETAGDAALTKGAAAEEEIAAGQAGSRRYIRGGTILAEATVGVVVAKDISEAAALHGKERDAKNTKAIKDAIQGNGMIAGAAIVGHAGAGFGAGLGEGLLPELGPVGPAIGAFVFGSLGGMAGAAIFSKPGKEVSLAFIDSKAGAWSIHHLGDAEEKMNIYLAGVEKANTASVGAQPLYKVSQWKKHSDAYGAALASGNQAEAQNALSQYEMYIEKLTSPNLNGGKAILSPEEGKIVDSYARNSFHAAFHDQPLTADLGQSAIQTGTIFATKLQAAQKTYEQTHDANSTALAQTKTRKLMSPSMGK